MSFIKTADQNNGQSILSSFVENILL